MKCPICGKDVELKNRQVGTDENGEPVFNEYAVCRDCKKQWNLDRQRAKKMAAKKAAAAADTGRKAAETGHGAAPEAPGSAAVKKAAPGKDEPVKKPVQKNTPAEESPDSKKKSAGKPSPEKTGTAKKPAARRKPVPADAEKESPAGSRTKKPDTDRSKVVPYKKSADAAGRTGKAEGSASPKKRPVLITAKKNATEISLQRKSAQSGKKQSGRDMKICSPLIRDIRLRVRNQPERQKKKRNP